MEKDFLKLKTDEKTVRRMILVSGLLLTILLGIQSFRYRELKNAYELPKAETKEEAYEQELEAYIGKQKIPVTVLVEERIRTEEEVEELLSDSEKILLEMIKGENESLQKITSDLKLLDEIPETSVEVTWVEIPYEYVYSNGQLRKDYELLEPVELKISAILTCQEYTRDFEATVTLLPRAVGIKEKLQKLIQPEKDKILLPEEYEGQRIVWKKPMDLTFVYIFVLTIAATVVLKLGSQKDAEAQKKERLEALEKDYAQIVSKFAMLLSAGLSVRNAWERIVLLQRRKTESGRLIYEELFWGFKEMQKGVSELEVYEKVGARIGLVHYKKLMALFISDKRRGTANLLDAMNQEMLSAFEEQKRKTKQEGEKIGTKLLLPMMGMLGVVFIMILVPAFLSFEL